MDFRLTDPNCLLVELPFRSADSPSIGLSLIKQGLLSRGYPCHIRYENLEFIRTIGEDLYVTISEHLPQELLIGEIVFAPRIWDHHVSIADLHLLHAPRTENRATCIP